MTIPDDARQAAIEQAVAHLPNRWHRSAPVDLASQRRRASIDARRGGS